MHTWLVTGALVVFGEAASVLPLTPLAMHAPPM